MELKDVRIIPINDSVTPSGFTFNTTMSFYNYSIPSGLKGRGFYKKMITQKGERNIKTHVKQIKNTNSLEFVDQKHLRKF